MRGETFVLARTVEITAQECPSCGVIYGLTESYHAARVSDGRTWHCPNGHSLSYTETDADRERKRAERAERATAAARQDLASERKAHSATKGKLTRERKRIANGVCPVCRRHFENVERHMHTQHPSFAVEAPDTPAGG